MAFINIHTNNLSRELRNNITFGDNWVYVPGTTITGDPDQIYMFTSLDDFRDTCGTYSPEGSITYEYVAGLLSAGLPVLFKRVASYTYTVGDVSTTVAVVKAKGIFAHDDPEDPTKQINDIEIEEKFGGTFGNRITAKVRNTGAAYYIDVYLDENTLLESNQIITYDSTAETQTLINERLIAALKTASDSFKRININVLEEDPDKFNLLAKSVKLTGGVDFDESYVTRVIPSLYKEIEDKILFEPKFITSGGYTDDAASTTFPISNAMLDLTRVRQDCRALIDLPINVAKDKQQEVAENIGYVQQSNTQVIPSGSVCAPWVYMQVGTNKLWMPPSYAYLVVVGDALSKGGNAYTPKAGLSTGVVPNIIKTQFEIGSDIAEKWQAEGEVNINPIMKLQSNSYVIAGNSTLLVKDINTGEENVFSESSGDLTVIEIRRLAYKAALEIQYQYNSLAAFEKFSMRVAKSLDTMISEGAITKYDIENISTDNEPRKLKVRLDVYLTPTIKYVEIFLNISYGSVEVNAGGEN